jgi:hypothetical protein
MLIGLIESPRTQPHASSRPRLGPGQCGQLAAIVAELLPGCSAELHHDASGNATIVILPEHLDKARGPVLFVRSNGSMFHLEELRWGTCRKLDDYTAWADVLRAVRIRLVWEMPFPTTLTDQRC